MPVPPNQVLVPVTIIQCIVPIVAEPGDRLMLLNGVCIGVDTSQHQQRGALVRALPAPPAKRKYTKHVKHNKPKKTKRAKRVVQTSAEVEARAARVVKALSITPMTLGELGRATKITSGPLKVALASLDRQGRLAPPEKTGTGNARSYQLAPGVTP